MSKPGIRCRIVLKYQDLGILDEIIEDDVSLDEAVDTCSDPQTSSVTCTTREGKERTARYGQWFYCWYRN